MKQNRKHLAGRRAAAVVLSGTLLASTLGVPTAAFGQTSEYEAAMTHLDALQMELAQSEAVLGKTTYDLAVTKSNIADLQIRIAENNKKLDEAKNDLADVIADTYKNGGDMGLLELVLSSESFENLVSRIYYANRLAVNKQNAIKAVNNLQANLKADMDVLEDQQREQEALLVDQVNQFAAMQDIAGQQAAYVSGLSEEVVAAMEQERIETTIASLELARDVLSVQTAEELAPAKEDTKAAAPVADAVASTIQQAEATTAEVAAPVAEATQATSSSSGASSAASGAAGALAAVNAALEQVGKNYGHENDGAEWDCNGLTNYAWSQAGVEIPYASGTYDYGQFQYMKESDNWVTSADDLKAGDLVFFSQDGGETTYHVAMYIGDGQIVHAVGYSEGVQVTDLDYVSGFCGGGTPVA